MHASSMRFLTILDFIVLATGICRTPLARQNLNNVVKRIASFDHFADALQKENISCIYGHECNSSCIESVFSSQVFFKH